MRFNAAPCKRSGSRIRPLGATADSKACSGHRSKAALTLTISRYRVSGYARLWASSRFSFWPCQPIIGVLVFLLFHLGGSGVREHNPFAAAIVLFYFLADFLASAVFLFVNSPGIGVLRVIIMALLLSNLRATWIAGGWKPDSEEAALPPRMGETFADKFSDLWPSFIWPKGKAALLHYIFSFGYLALTVAGLLVIYLRGRPL